MKNSPVNPVKRTNSYANTYKRGVNGERLISKVITMTGDEWDQLKEDAPSIRQYNLKRYLNEELSFSWLLHILSFQRTLALCAAVCFRLDISFGYGELKDGTTERTLISETDADAFDRISDEQDYIMMDNIARENRRKKYTQNRYLSKNQ